MGWKNVKEHYRIGHIVQVVKDRGICIGSGYIHDIIVIGFDGVIKKSDPGRANAEISRYQTEMNADPEKLKELVLSEDHFEKSITVYTYDGGYILEKKCEKLGWPNVTHDGQVMYDNTFSVDKTKVVKWAKREAEARIRRLTDRLCDLVDDLAKIKTYLEESKHDLKKL